MRVIKKYRWIWIVGGIAIALGLVLFSLGRIRGRSGLVAGQNSPGRSGAQEELGETAVAFIGDLTESATASGQVVARREATLSLAMSGVVTRLPVSVGDAVKAGDLLVQLETAPLERALRSAEIDVTIAQAELAELLADASAEDVAAASAAVASAQARLDELVAGPTATEIAASEAGVKVAEANMRSAAGKLQAARQVSSADILAAETDLEAALEQQESARNIWIRLAQCEPDASGGHSCTAEDNDRMRQINQNVERANAQVALARARLDELRYPDANNLAVAQANLDSATAQYDAAVARHEAFLRGASAAEIAAADADLASAQASLDTLLAGPLENDVSVYEIRLAQAETGLREAQNNLERATLLAPFDGVVTAVFVSQGEHASGPAVRLLDGGSLEVVLNVDEIDVGRLAVGQPASLWLETWPEVEISSSIMAVAPAASGDASGIVSYEVFLPLQDTGLPILQGMTANASLVTANLKDVLLVPSAALTADREKGTYAVNVVHRGDGGEIEVTPVDVTIGFRDRQHTQITSGLVEGDEVLMGELRAPTITFGFGNRGNDG